MESVVSLGDDRADGQVRAQRLTVADEFPSLPDDHDPDAICRPESDVDRSVVVVIERPVGSDVPRRPFLLPARQNLRVGCIHRHDENIAVRNFLVSVLLRHVRFLLSVRFGQSKNTLSIGEATEVFYFLAERLTSRRRRPRLAPANSVPIGVP